MKIIAICMSYMIINSSKYSMEMMDCMKLSHVLLTLLIFLA